MTTQSAYNERAERLARRFWANGVKRLRPQLKKFIAYLPNNALVLDAGCGAGEHMCYMEKRGLTTIGVDFSIGMLSRARKGMMATSF